MKWVWRILAFLVFLISVLIALLFTAPGNALLSPVVESKMNGSMPIKLRLERFVLRPQRFDIKLALSDGNAVEAVGNYSLFSRSLAARYRVELQDLSTLRPLTGQPLRGPFFTDGNVTGHFDDLTISGRSDVASGNTTYTTRIRQNTPEVVTLHMRNAAISELLYLLDKPAFADGRLAIDADVAPLDPDKASGELIVALTGGTIDRALMRRDFNVTLPKTQFTIDAQAAIAPAKTDYTLTLQSNLATIRSAGSVAPKPLAADLTYAVTFKELGLLTPLTGTPLRGPLSLDGSLKGDEKSMEVLLRSDLAESRTRLQAQLRDLKPVAAKLDVAHLKLARLLYMLEQPQYAKADISLHAELPSLAPQKYDGTVDLTLTNGMADRAVVAKAFEWPHFKGAEFDITLKSRLQGNGATADLFLKSSLADAEARRLTYDFGTSVLTGDFAANVPKLGALYFLTERPLQGSAEVIGDFRLDKAVLAHVNSDILGGSIKATLRDQQLHADLKGINTLKTLHMLTYPEVFDATLDGTMDYALNEKKGILRADLGKGRFTQNGAFDLLRQYTPVNLYAERFDGNTSARITDKRIVSDLFLRSSRSHIVSKKARIDSAQKTIDAEVHLNANNNPIDFRLTGRIDQPKVAVNADELIKREAGKQIDRLFKELFK